MGLNCAGLSRPRLQAKIRVAIGLRGDVAIYSFEIEMGTDETYRENPRYVPRLRSVPPVWLSKLHPRRWRLSLGPQTQPKWCEHPAKSIRHSPDGR